MSDCFEQMLRENVEKFSVELTDDQIAQFYEYYELLIEWNKVINLTAITDMEEVVIKHFVDSLSLVKAVSLNRDERSVIDVGTGAGFPGIPLKIAYPCLHITLLDSLNKRIRFLEKIILKLGLENMETVHGRAEDFGRDKKYREAYDICVSRAVANLSSLSEYCLPFVKVDGYFIAYKSGKAEKELKEAEGAIGKLGGRIERKETFILPGMEAARTLVKVKKYKVMDKKYPRKAGIPVKEPLK